MTLMATGTRTLKLVVRGFKTVAFNHQYVPLSSTTIASDLQGRDLVSFENYSRNDIQTLLWIALDLKESESPKKLCNNKSICMISDNPIRRISLSHAGVRVGASTSFIDPIQLTSDATDFELLGKTLGSAADIIFIDSAQMEQENAEKIATGCTVPVICTESSHFSPGYCLSQLMSLFEHYKYLRRLKVSYIGYGSDSMLNTYSILLPKVGMHLHFLVEGDMKESIWEKGVKQSIRYNTEFKQFDNLDDTVYRTHVVSSSPHDMSHFEVTRKHTKEMDLDWTLLVTDGYRKGTSVSEDLLRCKQSLIWNSISNLSWVFQAMIAAKITRYVPSIPRPGFEGAP